MPFPIFQEEVSQSVSKFMAYVHLSVNEMSKQYLLNERRYNYTTPKSFLELVWQHACIAHVHLETLNSIPDQPVSQPASQEAHGAH